MSATESSEKTSPKECSIHSTRLTLDGSTFCILETMLVVVIEKNLMMKIAKLQAPSSHIAIIYIATLCDRFGNKSMDGKLIMGIPTVQ